MLRMLKCVVVLALAAAACGGRGRGASGADEEVSRKTIVERMPDGSIRRTTVTTTRTRVDAPPPPPRPADPWPADPLVRYNVERINAYRAGGGVGPVLYDAKISAFARAGSERLAQDHDPHANFREHVDGAAGFGSRSAENQGDPSGVQALDTDALKSGKKQIDTMLRLMMDEGPGGGHHDNMMNARFRRVGVGLAYAGGRMYLTNDFSD
jgi:uncharacterized protein YkwD